MATYDWSTQDRVKITSQQLFAPAAVALGQVFAGIAAPTDDDYSLAFRFGTITTTGTAGPYAIQTNEDVGSLTVGVAAGVGANFTAGGLVVLVNFYGQRQVVEVDASHTGTDTIPLKNALKYRMNGGAALISRVPRVEVSFQEGIGTDTTHNYTEVLYLEHVQLEDVGFVATRLRVDHGTTFTVSTFDFTCPSMEITDFVDGTNVHRSDRRTPRSLMISPKVAPTAAATLFDRGFFSWGSGSRASAYGFGASINRYAEQHPPIRLKVVVTAGTDFTGGVTIKGLRSVWSPVREATNITPGSGIRVSIENYEQFQIGDVCKIYLTTGVAFNVLTITGKIPPDILTMNTGTVVNYRIDDVIGIEQTETINVTGGIGTYYSTDAWVMPMEHLTAGGSEDFTYEVFEMCQGTTGSLHSADARPNGGGNATVGQKAPINLLSMGQVETNPLSASPHTFFGQQSGAFTAPRNATQVIKTTGNSVIAFGVKDKYDLPSSPVFVMRGGTAPNQSFIQIAAAIPIVGYLFQSGVTAVFRHADAGDAQGFVGAGVFTINRGNRINAYTRYWFGINAGDYVSQANYGTLDDAHDALTPTSVNFGHQVQAFTNLDAMEDWIVQGGLTGSLAINPFFSYTDAQPFLVKGWNAELLKQSGSHGSNVVAAFATASNYLGRLVDCYFSDLYFNNATGAATHTLQSAISANFLVVEENGKPIPGARVQIVDGTGTTLVDAGTDFSGRTAPDYILVTHSWNRTANASGIVQFRKDETPPAAVTRTIFTPFIILISADGFEPYTLTYLPKPFTPVDKIDMKVVLKPPSEEGRF